MKIKQLISTSWDKDSHDVHWLVDEISQGYGYQNKESLKIGLIRCPICESENYSPKVITGQCAWCPFNANKNNYEEAKQWLDHNRKTK